jgi:DnaJ-class molecular chaperone
VFVDLSVPKGLNNKQKQLLKQLAKSMGHDDIDGPDEAEEQPKSKGLFDRVKDSFT